MVTTLWAASRAQLRFLKRGYAKRVRGSEAREVHEGSSGRITIWPVVLTFHPGQLPAGACSHLIALRQGAASPLLMGVCSQTTRLCRTTAQRPGSLFWELQRANGRYLRRRKPIGARTCESSFGDGHRRVPLRGCTRNRQLQQRPDVLLRGPHLGLGFVQFTTRLRRRKLVGSPGNGQVPSLPTGPTLPPARVQKRTHFNFTLSYRCREALLRDEAYYSLLYARASRSPSWFLYSLPKAVLCNDPGKNRADHVDPCR